MSPATLDLLDTYRDGQNMAYARLHHQETIWLEVCAAAVQADDRQALADVREAIVKHTDPVWLTLTTRRVRRREADDS